MYRINNYEILYSAKNRRRKASRISSVGSAFSLIAHYLFSSLSGVQILDGNIYFCIDIFMSRARMWKGHLGLRLSVRSCVSILVTFMCLGPFHRY